jgi:23S rRNA (pseudouridine1915-N3)-methyltransferase
VRERYIADAIADFRVRLRPYHRIEEAEVRAADGADPARAKRAEGEAILKLLDPADRVWLLERTGESFSSEELARRIERLPHEGVARLTIIVAGTYGASDSLLQRADLRWSLSPLTLLHEWARALVMEQVYRAAKIARDEPYHH